MIIVMGHAKLGAGEIDRLGAEMEAQITATRAEDGCLAYGFARDVLDPDTLIITLAAWRDKLEDSPRYKSRQRVESPAS